MRKHRNRCILTNVLHRLCTRRDPELSIGVLIVGSLYWDESPSRRSWRENRLDLSNVIRVSAPIRYGRESEKTRGGTYTMVFSPELVETNQFGLVIAVPCKRFISSVEGLIDEAEKLWTAERNSDTSNGKISAEWGCVALLVNPRSNIPEPFLRGWEQQAAKEPGYGRLSRANYEHEIVSVNGTLRIPWPQRTDNQPLTFDLLLTTATDSTIRDGRYAAPKEIANAWNNPKGRNYVSYFVNNRKNGITTFQDEEIASLLSGGLSVEGEGSQDE